MSDLSSAANSMMNSLTEGGLVEEYEITKNGRRVKRGAVVDQVDAVIKLDALTKRQSSQNLFSTGVIKGDREGC